MLMIAARLLAGALLVAALAAAGCGGDDQATTPVTPEAPTETTTAGDTVAATIKDTAFVPKDIEVDAGQRVVWTNEDPFTHTVTKDSGPGGPFDSGDVEGGGTFEQTFEAPGTIDYLCEIHPGQTGTITVKK